MMKMKQIFCLHNYKHIAFIKHIGAEKYEEEWFMCTKCDKEKKTIMKPLPPKNEP